MIENNSVNGYEAINASKPEIINFKTKLETITKHLNFRVSSQKINPITSIKYLGLNNSLTSGIYFKNLETKLNRAIGLLFKVRHYTPKSPLKRYISPYLTLISYILVKHGNTAKPFFKTKIFQEIEKLQDKAIRIINFL